eukprot:Gb_37816 [translate_table: standard]
MYGAMRKAPKVVRIVVIDVRQVGVVEKTKQEAKRLYAKSEPMAKNLWSLGGRATEEIIFEEPEVTSGATGDPNSKIEKLAEDIDKAVKAILDKAYEIAKTHIRDNQSTMDKIVEILLGKETLSRDEF